MAAPDTSELEQRVWYVVDRLDKKMDDITSQVSAVREAQIRMEAADHSGNYERLEAKIIKLEAKVITLEAADAKQTGVVIALEWAYKLGPWIALTVLALNNSLGGVVG